MPLDEQSMSEARATQVSVQILGKHCALDAVLFDLDGTLYRQQPLRTKMARDLFFLPFRLRSMRRARSAIRQIYAYRHALETLRTEPLGDEEIDLAVRQCEIAALQAHVTPEEIARTANEWLHERPLRYLRSLRREGVSGLLDSLRHAGVRLGVFSDYPVEAKLEALELRNRFEVTACASDAGIMALKPSPKGLLVACSKLGCEPARTLYVGDRVDVDGEAAQRAGMPCAIVGKQAARAPGDMLGTPSYADLAQRLSGL